MRLVQTLWFIIHIAVSYSDSACGNGCEAADQLGDTLHNEGSTEWMQL
jgi:hypothetical protein